MFWYEGADKAGACDTVRNDYWIGARAPRAACGIKTHILVCVGAAVVSLIQVYMIEETIKMIGDDSSLASV